MSRAATAPQPTTQYAEQDGEFDRLVKRGSRMGGLFQELCSREERIETVLPDFMKGQAKRLIHRAMMSFAAKQQDLGDCPDQEFCRCVVEAAELGFAIDNKLAYVVKYKTRFQLQLDYKAMVAVARRNRTLVDIDADVVCKGDHFRHGRYSDNTVCEHTFDLDKPRGECIGAFCRIFLPNGGFNYVAMTRAELDKIESMSKAKYDGRPWQQWPEEMRKKTVIRRALKLYQDDPGLMRMLEITGWEDDASDDDRRPKTIDALDRAIRQPRVEPDEPPDTGERPQVSDEPDAALLDELRQALAAAYEIGNVKLVTKAEEEFRTKAKDEFTRMAVSNLCDECRERIKASPSAGGKTQKQLA